MIVPRADPSTSPIGQIVKTIEWNLYARLRGAPFDQSVAQQLYEEADVLFGDRLDYRVWRTAVTPHFSKGKSPPIGIRTLVSDSWEVWPRAVIRALAQNDPLVVWSLVGIAPQLMLETQSDSAKQDDVLNTLGWLALQLPNLLPLRDCPASCAIAAVYFLLSRQHLYHELGQSFGIDDVTQLLDQVRAWLRVVDPVWLPGRKLDMSAVKNEGETYRVRPAHPAAEFTFLVKTLAAVRPSVSSKINALDAQGERLLEDVYQFSLTAWQMARSRRIQEQRYQEERGWNDEGRQRTQRAFETEFSCHLDLSSAARDSGEYLQSAKFLYLLFRLIPDDFRDLDVVREELSHRQGTIRYIKEVGLEVDPRFSVDQESLEIQEEIKRKHDLAAAKWRKGAILAASRGSEKYQFPESNDDTGFALRVRRDTLTLAEWATVLTCHSPLPTETPPGFLLTVMKGLADHKLSASSPMLVAGFKLALHYGYVRSAGKILSRSIQANEFELTQTILMDFVHAVRRCLQLDPFGLRHERWEDWQKLIKAGCLKLWDQHGANWMPESSSWWLHETLLNRTYVHHQSLNVGEARRLFEKSYNAHDTSELRDFYDLSYDFGRRFAGVANKTTVTNALGQLADGTLGRPVAVSLVMTGAFVSIVAIGPNGQMHATQCYEIELAKDVARMSSPGEVEYWFKTASDATYDEISWPGSLRRLSKSVVTAGLSCYPSAQVFLLSMDAALAQLPWQHLLNVPGQPHTRLVSIVPSLSAFCLKSTRLTPPRETAQTALLSTEAGDRLRELVKAVEESTQHLELGRMSICIVAGHGGLSAPGGFPAVRLGPDRVIDTLDKWLDVAGARIAILHCCHSGLPRPLFMEEFGGFAGLAICVGTKTVLAPVAEVYSSTAMALHARLFEQPTRAIGIAYLEAIRADPSCCLYSLYGNPYERLDCFSSSVALDAPPTVSKAWYMRFPPSLRSYYPGSTPPDWEEQLLEDASYGGRFLCAMKLVPNEMGPRLAVFGSKFYFEIGRDRNRLDTLYVIRIERAKPRPPDTRFVECEVCLWPGGVPPSLDGTSDLFESSLSPLPVLRER